MKHWTHYRWNDAMTTFNATLPTDIPAYLMDELLRWSSIISKRMADHIYNTTK